VPGGWRVFGRGGGGRRRGYGEAACFGDAGDEGVEPLAGEELEMGVRFGCLGVGSWFWFDGLMDVDGLVEMKMDVL
jgi:hypothetical protein